MVNTLQVTVGTGVTAVATVSVPVKQVVFQNNGSNVCRVGGLGITTAIGYDLLTAGANTVVLGNGDYYVADLREFFLRGTNHDVIDVTYIT